VDKARWFGIGIATLAATAFAWTSAAVAQGAKAACSGDIQKFCANVPQGGGAIAKCLRSHRADLTPDCQKGMQAMASQMKEVAMACEDDVHRYCAGSAPGTTKDCLKTHFRELSRPCKRELFEAKRSM
jgi:hypothetical protein